MEQTIQQLKQNIQEIKEDLKAIEKRIRESRASFLATIHKQQEFTSDQTDFYTTELRNGSH